MMKRVSTLTMMAVSLFAWGCDSLSDTTQPELAPSAMVVKSITGEILTVGIEADPDAGSVSKTIGRAGGVLVLGAHTLKVSEGAVSAPTLFTMTRDAEQPLRVHLTAGRESQNDVGAAGFKAPVTLSLNFDEAENVPADRSSITMVYYRPDGLVEPLETDVGTVSTVDSSGLLRSSLSIASDDLATAGDVATAELPHFSLFGIAWP